MNRAWRIEEYIPMYSFFRAIPSLTLIMRRKPSKTLAVIDFTTQSKIKKELDAHWLIADECQIGRHISVLLPSLR